MGARRAGDSGNSLPSIASGEIDRDSTGNVRRMGSVALGSVEDDVAISPAYTLHGGNTFADDDDRWQVVDEMINIAGHNGWVGTTWNKDGLPRRVVELIPPRADSKLGVMLKIEKTFPDGTIQHDYISIGRIDRYFDEKLKEGSISEVKIPDNQAAVLKGDVGAWDRNPTTWKMEPREPTPVESIA